MMYKTTLLFMIFTGVFAAGCGKFSKFPGYKRVKHGVYYQLHAVGEDTVKPHQGDYISVNLTYMTLDDSVFFQGARKFQVNRPAYDGSIDECFQMLSAEESATFIISADQFFAYTLQTNLPKFITPGSKMKVKIDMIGIQSEENYNREKEAFLSWIDDFGEYEKVILQQFIREEKLDVSPLPSGIYYLNLRPGKGKKVELGDTITINYEGRFLNGKFFDSTVKRRQPFQFVYGTEWQVIKGLEEAIGIMCEGEKSLFILPSDMGFGNNGSSNNTIPPFTSLIYEVEILKVSSPGKI
jgi:FKBP-type peptidyl-prolyl cis-trans isomerase FkpA